jgi:hypothetical protein
MTITTDLAPQAPTGHAGWFADIRRLLDIIEVTPGLPLPYISKDRATFFYTGITHPDEATSAVRCAETILRSAFMTNFAPRVTEAHGVRHDILTAVLPSGLTVDLVTLAARAEKPPVPRTDARQLAEAMIERLDALHRAVAGREVAA